MAHVCLSEQRSSFQMIYTLKEFLSRATNHFLKNKRKKKKKKNIFRRLVQINMGEVLPQSVYSFPEI